MCPSGSSGGRTVMVVDETSKLPLFDGGRQFVDGNKHVRGNGVAIEDVCE